jgi:hypothetical protein
MTRATKMAGAGYQMSKRIIKPRKVFSGFAGALLFFSLSVAYAQTGPVASFIWGLEKLPNGGRPLRKQAFPKIADWGTLRIALQRTECFGDCPAYLIEVDGAGTVRYEGQHFVAVQGKHTAHIPKEEVRKLYLAFEKANFFWTLDKYEAKVTDLPTQALSISFDGRSKQVIDYGGLAIGMPKELAGLENLLDAVTQSQTWVKGDANTIPNLLHENWNFRAKTNANSLLISSAASKGNTQLVRDLLKLGVYAKTKFGCMGAKAAARDGNAEVVAALLEAEAPIHWPNKEYDCDVLSAAAISGRVKIVQLVLSRHPDVNWQDTNGTTPLMNAVEGRIPEASAGRDDAAVTKILIAAGADVNLRDQSGKSAIMRALNSAGAVRALIAAGAKDINRRAQFGKTALMEIYDGNVAQAMLESGANPWLTDETGKNALEIVSQTYGPNNDAAKILRRWMATHR